VPEAEKGLTAALVGFARLLRERGVRTSPAQVVRLQAAVGVLAPERITHLYWAGRACLAVGPGTVDTYDAAFGQYFLAAVGGPAEQSAACRRVVRASGSGDQPDPLAAVPVDVAQEPGDAADRPDGDAAQAGRTASAAEVLRITPFAACTPEELDTVAALVRRLRVRPPQRRGRRREPGRRRQSIDLRATARRAIKTQADLLIPAWRQRQLRPRRVVLLIDVSRSMAPYSRMYLHFGYALVTARADARVVCFGTQLTAVTWLLRSRKSAHTLELAATSVLDWNGGTRIASAVAGLQSLRGVRGALRGAVVVICSDGLEQGDPAGLGRQMRKLARTCAQIIWVNPLAGDERYQPLAGGMRAALPFLDRLMPGDTVAALGEVAAAISGQTAGRR
jgi:uncharacterized protein with von Willebrand factor type A (vWA) domain